MDAINCMVENELHLSSQVHV